jgi:hypothetical protein
VGRCGGTLLSDALAIKQVVPHEFYEVPLETHPRASVFFFFFFFGVAWAAILLTPAWQLYLGVAALLSAKRPLSFALCKYCARKCALTWEGKLLCWCVRYAITRWRVCVRV